MDTVPERPADSGHDALARFQERLATRVLGPDWYIVVRHMTLPELQAVMWVGLHGGTGSEANERAGAAVLAALERIVAEQATVRGER